MTELSSSDIRDVILKEDDYGHEVRVGAILRSSSNATVEHGGTYNDLITDKPRQFDYRCWVNGQSSRLVLAVECKNISPTAPLIICGTDRPRNEAFHDLIQSRQGRFEDGRVIQVGLSSVTRRVSRNNLLYPEGGFVGKSLLRVQPDKRAAWRQGESEVYDRWSQALSSAIELVRSAMFVAKHLSETKVLSAIVPAVVVPDGTLWNAIYDNSGALVSEPTHISECPFYVGREIEVAERGKPWFQTFTFSHVHFFTMTGLERFLSQLTPGTAAWQKICVDEKDTVVVSSAYPRDPANASTVGASAA